jgi:MFS family permease
MFITFMPLHCQNNRLPVGQIGLIFLTQGFFNAACRIPFGRISDKVLDRRRLVVFGIGLVAVSMMGLGFSAHILSFLVFAGLLGIAMAIAFTSIGALIAEMVDDASRGLAMGGYNACIFFGMMASSGIMGDVIQVTGFEKGFLLSAAASSVAVVGFLWLSKNYLKAEEHSR